MKRKLAILIMLTVALTSFASTASAIHLLDSCLQADCTKFRVSASVLTYQNIFLWYRVTLTPETGDPESFEGAVPVNVAVLWTPETVPVCREVCWPTVLCGDYTVTGRVELRLTADGPPIIDGGVEHSRDFCPITVECPCSCCPGVGTPGYWKNHPDAWPVESITIGGVTYTKEQAIAILLDNGEGGDKTITLFRSLVAAKLNGELGCETSCITEALAGADAWMAQYGPVGSGVSAGGRTSPWRTGECFYLVLDQYNNGLLCAPSRDSMENGYIGKAAAKVPAGKLAIGNYPNPFNPNTTISFTLPEPSRVTMKIFNSLGAEVATLTDRQFSSGQHSVDWNARGMASGIYFCRIQAGPRVAIRKLMLLK